MSNNSSLNSIVSGLRCQTILSGAAFMFLHWMAEQIFGKHSHCRTFTEKNAFVKYYKPGNACYNEFQRVVLVFHGHSVVVLCLDICSHFYSYRYEYNQMTWIYGF
jgi:hypothetical protein